MSIIMPGKMPDRCTSCVFCDDYFDDGDFGLCCSISGSRIYGRERLKDCPVIELPPHGRLIDADALKIYQMEENVRADGEPNEYEYDAGLIDGLHMAAKDVSVAPTIIPAEEEEP